MDYFHGNVDLAMIKKYVFRRLIGVYHLNEYYLFVSLTHGDKI
jgi:hypothetical protein